MKIKIGNKNIKNIYLGNKKVSKVYLGEKLILDNTQGKQV